MRKMFLSALSLAIAGAIATQASAAVTASFINTGVPQGFNRNFDPIYTSGFTSYVLVLTSDSGVISAFDFGAGNTGGFHTSTYFAELQSAGIGPTFDDNGYSTAIGSANDQSFSGDTHFVGDPSHFSVGSAPAEQGANYTATGNPNPFANTTDAKYTNPGKYAIGSTTGFTGALGITGAFQATTQEVAYFVVPTGTTISFTGASVATQNGTFIISASTGAVPEPASLGVLALGAVSLLARRRRA